MAYNESDFQTDWNRWVKIILRRTAAHELKVSKTDSIPFSVVKEHQEQFLFHVKHGTVSYKIPDDTYSQKPCDSISLHEELAIVVIMFNAKSPFFYIIDIDKWLEEKQRSVRRSLTIERAEEIGEKYDLAGSIPYDKRKYPHFPQRN